MTGIVFQKPITFNTRVPIAMGSFCKFAGTVLTHLFRSLLFQISNYDLSVDVPTF